MDIFNKHEFVINYKRTITSRLVILTLKIIYYSLNLILPLPTLIIFQLSCDLNKFVYESKYTFISN